MVGYYTNLSYLHLCFSSSGVAATLFASVNGDKSPISSLEQASMIFLMSLPEGPGILLIMIAYHKAPAAALAPFWYLSIVADLFGIFFGKFPVDKFFPWAPLIISVLGIDNTGKVFLLFMVSLSIMIISARAGASGTQLSKIHAAHSLGASKKQILRYVIFPNSLPEILTGIRVAVGMCWGTLVAAEFLAGTTGIGFVENVAKKYFQYEVIWITIFIMGMLGLLFDITLRKIIDKTIPWRGKG